MKLTANEVAKIELPAGKSDAIFFDDDISGFGIRLRQGGGKPVWLFQYKIGGRTRRMTFGRYPAMEAPDARKKAKELHAKVGMGGDPASDKADSRARSGETFEACLTLYLGRRRNETKLRASTYDAIERHLMRNLEPLHKLRIDKVDRRAIALELARLTTESGPIQANRTRSSLVKFLNWCAGEGFIDANPAMFTNKNEEKSRDRVLTDQELGKIWHAVQGGDFGDIIRLLMLTGAREREISELHWHEIDFDRSVITLPPTRTKNHRRHTIPLSEAAASILKARAPLAGRELVFGTGQGGYSNWSKAKLKLDERVKEGTPDGKALAPWVLHDLRRSAATGMNELGIQPHIVEAVLGHISGSKGGVAGVYNKAGYEPEKTTALNRWAEHLATVIAGRDSNVAPLRRA